MPDENSYEIGRSAEENAAAILGGKLVPQSGGGHFIKLDFHDKAKFIYSVKASRTIKDAGLRAIRKLWAEAITGTRGFSGHGDGAKPGMVFEMDGELLVLLRLADHADVGTGAISPYIEPSKAQERRDRSRISRIG